MEFNFNKGPATDSTESKELKAVNPVKAPADIAELTGNTPEGLENKHEIAKASEPTKAVVTYIGRGVWTDNKGNNWLNGTVCSFDIEEFETREDLEFMIKYGAMKVSLV